MTKASSAGFALLAWLLPSTLSPVVYHHRASDKTGSKTGSNKPNRLDVGVRFTGDLAQNPIASTSICQNSRGP